ncbi:radical SAM-linked protein [Natranaerovirga hydrolytica]|uniref:Radical SAM-linked protein n=1 Tax=Natranaerovirga hydrolytica TaxID=680378 RepID=A0A4V2Q1M0_9FIRM|nr:TIGR03936 family radical SAM-associated protein [Natranaerovirga hydrolytica]TCK98131.1 radical SAM-linked protein [Natranaerovirga hydrolytica]
MKVRIKFTKENVMKFVGHLDLLRLFQKAFRRADIPIAFSQGFHPHQLISIGAPLPIGVTSEGEYLDIELKEDMNEAEGMAKLNEALPKDMKVLDWIKLDDNAKSSMAIIGGASYTITPKNWGFSYEETLKKINDFMSQEAITIMKKNKKKKLKEVNIKEGIFVFNYTENKQFKMFLATGSKLNVKPDLVLKSLCDFLEIEYNMFDFDFHRNELYVFVSDKYIPLDQL